MHCAIYSYIVQCESVFAFCCVFSIVVVWNGCHFAVWPISIGQTEKWHPFHMITLRNTWQNENSLAWYDVAICIAQCTPVFYWISLNYRLYIRLDSLMDKALDLRIRVVSSSPGMGKNFSFCNSRFSLLAARVSPCPCDILRANTLCRKKVR